VLPFRLGDDVPLSKLVPQRIAVPDTLGDARAPTIPSTPLANGPSDGPPKTAALLSPAVRVHPDDVPPGTFLAFKPGHRAP
jgi:hypothetical protein